jgi:hypothetical protein
MRAYAMTSMLRSSSSSLDHQEEKERGNRRAIFASSLESFKLSR